jgi:hypothetical protein
MTHIKKYEPDASGANRAAPNFTIILIAVRARAVWATALKHQLLWD